MQRSPVLFRRKRRILRIRGLLLAVARGNCCSQLPHTAPTGPVRGFGGVVPLPGSQNRTQGRTGASLFFLPKTSLPLPLKGEGLGIVCCLVRLVFSHREARCFSAEKDGYFVSEGFSRQLPMATAAHNCPTRLQQGLFGASVVSFPYPALKTSHRAEFDFTVVFWCAFALAVTPSLAPACN